MSKVIHMALVDDEIDVEIIYKTFLRKEISKGIMELFFFEDGQSVLDFLNGKGSNCQILILVSDINMPNMDGLTLVEIVNKEFPHIDLYLSSAYDQSDAKEQMDQANVKNYLEKPVDFEMVKKIVHDKYEEINKD